MCRYCLEAVRALLERRLAVAEAAGGAAAAAGAPAAAAGEQQAAGGGGAADAAASAATADADAAAARRRTDQAADAQDSNAGAGGAAAAGGAGADWFVADAALAARAATREPLLSLLDPDVSANVLLAWGKLFLYRLVASHDQWLLGRPAAAGVAGPAAVPAAARWVVGVWVR